MAPVKHDPPPSAPSRSSHNSLITKLVGLAKALLFDRRYFWHLTSILFLGELCLGLLIIRKVPYTKIDWPAYMEQVEGFLAGERDYSKLEGDTGPLVYPALHLYIYTAFYKLLPAVNRIPPAQYVFLAVYLTTFLSISTIYYLSGRSHLSPDGTTQTGPPQALLIPLTLSKRAHSIYLLRLFNDPLAMVLMYLSVVTMMIGGKRGWSVASVLYSLALGVKMNILLFLPGLLVLLFQYRGLYGTIQGVSIIGLIQLALPAPFFLTSKRHSLSYLKSAFDFSRQFLYEWTVNWRFISVETFLSKDWARGLLIAHLTTLVAFAWFKWSPVPGRTWGVLRRGLFHGPRSWGLPSTSPLELNSSRKSLLSPEPSADRALLADVPLVLFTSNLIGMTFARSLHYQFHSWYFHSIPFLLYSGGAWGSPVLGFVLWAMIEWAWASAPSTIWSSGAMLVAHLVILAGLWRRSDRRKVKSKNT